ncbi:gcvT [Symbiodinium sp. KB8]|nr:gcvT [Symbiodinium sp. KB8]
MVEFAGYYLPVQYKAGVLTEHNHTRDESGASLFDVSHMGQLRLTGDDAIDFLQGLVVGDVAALGPGDATLSLFTNAQGGIIDDTVITSYMADQGFVSVVVNGANKHTVAAHMDAALKAYMAAKPSASVEIHNLFDRHLLALQGPAAASVLSPLVQGGKVDALSFMNGANNCIIDGVDAGPEGCMVTRCGYTGEDGFEIAVPAESAEQLARKLLASAAVMPAGLGARDSLRLEAGLCLHGNDIGEDTTPIEAGLAWTIPKSRRADARFPGADVILSQLKEKSWARRRVGLRPLKVPARHGAKIFSGDEQIGEVTSGTFSPTLKVPLSMGYVNKGFQKKGTEVEIEVREGKRVPAVVDSMPFVPARYFKAA